MYASDDRDHGRREAALRSWPERRLSVCLGGARMLARQPYRTLAGSHESMPSLPQLLPSVSQIIVGPLRNRGRDIDERVDGGVKIERRVYHRSARDEPKLRERRVLHLVRIVDRASRFFPRLDIRLATRLFGGT
jgi:hypothetical protein